ncbi:MAG: glycogen/starch synthase [Patescibacteria group bacterium]
MKQLNVLITGYEGAPFYKKGGLGDVMESLPKALSKIGVDMRIVLPYYNVIKEKYNLKKEGEFAIEFNSTEEHIGIYSALLPNTSVRAYFLGNRRYLFSSNSNGKDKRIEQFAFFSLAVTHFIHWVSEHHHWSPSLVHCNDWHTALIPLILKQKEKSSIPTLLTIHNLLYQGIGSLRVLDLLNMKDEEAKELKRGKPATEINVLGEGIIHATRVSTVSVSYAKEIANDYDNSPIGSFLKKREDANRGRDGKIIGILNGIDYDVWNSATDEIIFHKFGVGNWEGGKKDNKEDLLKSLRLEDRTTFCFVGRLAKQKGLDILIKAITGLESLNINVIILGAGNPIIQESVLDIAKQFPWVKAEIVYSEELAHKIYAGSDFIIIPSRYEPCGLIQMIAMKYGTIPIASDTGGLRDSILNGKNGFLFKKGKSARLKKTIERALGVWKDHSRYEKMVWRAMKTDFSWDKSAVLYKKLYEEMIK